MWCSHITSSRCGCFQKLWPFLRPFYDKSDGLTTLWLFVLSDSFSALCEGKIKERWEDRERSFSTVHRISSIMAGCPKSRLIGSLPLVVFEKACARSARLPSRYRCFKSRPKTHLYRLACTPSSLTNSFWLLSECSTLKPPAWSSTAKFGIISPWFSASNPQFIAIIFH